MKQRQKHNRNLVLPIFAVMCGVFIWYAHHSHVQYEEMLYQNTQLQDRINSMAVGSHEIYEQANSDYDRLLDLYGEKLAEIDRLNKQLATVEIPVYDYTMAEIELLAKATQCEAGNAEQAQKHVASVILNRVSSPDYPNTIEEVIYQKVQGVPQFSVAYDGSIEKCELRSETLVNVYSVIVHGTTLPKDVVFFYSSDLEKDNWIKTLDVYTEIHGTIFCRR